MVSRYFGGPVLSLYTSTEYTPLDGNVTTEVAGAGVGPVENIVGAENPDVSGDAVGTSHVWYCVLAEAPVVDVLAIACTWIQSDVYVGDEVGFAVGDNEGFRVGDTDGFMVGDEVGWVGATITNVIPALA